MNAPLLTMSDVSKRFGATQALSRVSLEVEAGQVRALIGENGAGKSTLMKILAGAIRADAGRMTVAGEEYSPTGPADARRRGVAMIFQELNLAPHLSVEANILLGQERSRFGLLRRSEGRAIARRALARLAQAALPLDAPVGSLSIGAQQLVEIARALASDARVLVLDEPTSSLTEEDTARLFEVIRELRAAGLGIIYISHFLEEVAEISDVYTVLRDGRSVASGRIEETTLDAIVRQMVGRDLDELFPHVPHEAGEVLLRVKSLSGVKSPRGVELELRRGEIFGLAGLIGAGRSELVRTIFGLERVVSGEVAMADGVRGGAVGRSPRQSIERGLGLVSENRKEEGLAVELSVADNLTYTRLSPYRRGGVLNLRRRDAVVREYIERVRCKTTGPGQAVVELSGGNQQKIAIARLLHQDADVFLLDEPTRGIDVGTKAEIYRLVGELARAGKTIVLVSSYLPELLGVCDRIGVMCRGELREVRPTSEWSEESIMHCATGREQVA